MASTTITRSPSAENTAYRAVGDAMLNTSLPWAAAAAPAQPAPASAPAAPQPPPAERRPPTAAEAQTRAQKMNECRLQALKDHPQGGPEFVKEYTACIQEK